jgi:hypothetical protein
MCEANGWSTAELLAEIDPGSVVTPEIMASEVSRRVNEALAQIRTGLAQVKVIGDHVGELADKVAAETVIMGAMLSPPPEEPELTAEDLDEIEQDIEAAEQSLVATLNAGNTAAGTDLVVDLPEEEELPFEGDTTADIMEEEERPFEDDEDDGRPLEGDTTADIMEEEERPLDGDDA